MQRGISKPAGGCYGVGRRVGRFWFHSSGQAWRLDAGVTLIELLCVCAIIGILASLLFPAVFRVYFRVKATAEEMEAGGVAELLLQETRNYCAANPKYQFASKTDYLDKCHLAPKCQDWVRATATEFTPFNYLDPTNKLVMAFHFGRNRAHLYTFTKGELSMQPRER